MNMNNSMFFPFLFFLFSSASFFTEPARASLCPVDLSYVETFPWDTFVCRDPNQKGCCQALLSLFGVGLAQHLKDTSMFQLPDANSSSACLSDFQARLAHLSINPSLIPFCFDNATQFVANASSCAGIITTEDWTKKAGPVTALDGSCKGNLTLTRCSSCLDAGLKVNSQLFALDPNSSKCFYFVILYAAAFVNEFGPKDTSTAACILGLPLATSATNSYKPRNKLSTLLLKLVFGILGGAAGVLMSLAVTILYKKWEKKRKGKALHQEFITSFKSSVLPNSGAKWFGILELERATNGFSRKNLIGQGAHGVVYRGNLSDGTLVAVKQILDLDSTRDEEFTNEVEIISKIRHRNLLSLRGCCIASDNLGGRRRYLVYDFMPNGSLGDHLFDIHGRKRSHLTWPQRKNIILDVAKGLSYLHHGLKPGIYHRDVKATNILLDSEMKAKVADFGLAKQSLEGQSHLTTRVAGTHGYLAPEYALYGQLTEKTDVYSFGILCLEIMSGRKVIDTSKSSSFLLITDWAWTLAKAGNIEQVFDESIRGGPKVVMERFVLVGILCAHVMVAFRPTISDALRMLEGDIDIPTLPDRPLPLTHESFAYSSWHGEKSSSSTQLPRQHIT
ncbi:probable receptor-like protein kinase At1g11050 [Carica papaya]|uniref:probable receptor-like protein kinase At1g11050 n=1 Tax=Carica papaya TaxID=3649 RepID=UPI000B8CAA69|nr:probable receptor-like protein kinase At1g11050 [Carica papaya]